MATLAVAPRRARHLASNALSALRAGVHEGSAQQQQARRLTSPVFLGGEKVRRRPPPGAASAPKTTIPEVWGYVHSAESCSGTDGPGLRYLLFLQGCPRRCIFCSNPDTWEKDGIAAARMSSKEIHDRIARCAPYLRPHCGGLTVSGGEPLMQPNFVAAVFRETHAAGLTTCLDTTGFGSPKAWKTVLLHTDFVLFCPKSTDPAMYHRLTRSSGASVRPFLAELDRRGIPFWLRFVLIPGLTDSKEELAGIAEMANAHGNCRAIELLPYHRLGVEKWHEMGLEYPLAGAPLNQPEEVESAKNFLEEQGCKYLGITLLGTRITANNNGDRAAELRRFCYCKVFVKGPAEEADGALADEHESDPIASTRTMGGTVAHRACEWWFRHGFGVTAGSSIVVELWEFHSIMGDSLLGRTSRLPVQELQVDSFHATTRLELPLTPPDDGGGGGDHGDDDAFQEGTVVLEFASDPAALALSKEEAVAAAAGGTAGGAAGSGRAIGALRLVVWQARAVRCNKRSVFVAAKLGRQEKQTEVKDAEDDLASPVFDTNMVFDVHDLGDDCRIEVTEVHKLRKDRIVGQVVIPMAALLDGWGPRPEDDAWYEILPFVEPAWFNRNGQYRTAMKGTRADGFGLPRPDAPLGFLRLRTELRLHMPLPLIYFLPPEGRRAVEYGRGDKISLASIKLNMRRIERRLLVIPLWMSDLSDTFRWRRSPARTAAVLALYCYCFWLMPLWQLPLIACGMVVGVGYATRGKRSFLSQVFVYQDEINRRLDHSLQKEVQERLRKYREITGKVQKQTERFASLAEKALNLFSWVDWRVSCLASATLLAAAAAFSLALYFGRNRTREMFFYAGLWMFRPKSKNRRKRRGGGAIAASAADQVVAGSGSASGGRGSVAAAGEGGAGSGIAGVPGLDESGCAGDRSSFRTGGAAAAGAGAPSPAGSGKGFAGLEACGGGNGRGGGGGPAPNVIFKGFLYGKDFEDGEVRLNDLLEGKGGAWERRFCELTAKPPALHIMPRGVGDVASADSNSTNFNDAGSSVASAAAAGGPVGPAGRKSTLGTHKNSMAVLVPTMRSIFKKNRLGSPGGRSRAATTGHGSFIIDETDETAEAALGAASAVGASEVHRSTSAPTIPRSTGGGDGVGGGGSGEVSSSLLGREGAETESPLQLRTPSPPPFSQFSMAFSAAPTPTRELPAESSFGSGGSGGGFDLPQQFFHNSPPSGSPGKAGGLGLQAPWRSPPSLLLASCTRAGADSQRDDGRAMPSERPPSGRGLGAGIAAAATPGALLAAAAAALPPAARAATTIDLREATVSDTQKAVSLTVGGDLEGDISEALLSAANRAKSLFAGSTKSATTVLLRLFEVRCRDRRGHDRLFYLATPHRAQMKAWLRAIGEARDAHAQGRVIGASAAAAAIAGGLCSGSGGGSGGGGAPDGGAAAARSAAAFSVAAGVTDGASSADGDGDVLSRIGSAADGSMGSSAGSGIGGGGSSSGALSSNGGGSGKTVAGWTTPVGRLRQRRGSHDFGSQETSARSDIGGGGGIGPASPSRGGAFFGGEETTTVALSSAATTGGGGGGGIGRRRAILLNLENRAREAARTLKYLFDSCPDDLDLDHRFICARQVLAKEDMQKRLPPMRVMTPQQERFVLTNLLSRQASVTALSHGVSQVTVSLVGASNLPFSSEPPPALRGAAGGGGIGAAALAMQAAQAAQARLRNRASMHALLYIIPAEACGLRFQSSRKARSASPVWREDFNFPIKSTAATVVIELYHRKSDMNTKDKLLGVCCLSLACYLHKQAQDVSLPLSADRDAAELAFRQLAAHTIAEAGAAAAAAARSDRLASPKGEGRHWNGGRGGGGSGGSGGGDDDSDDGDGSGSPGGGASNSGGGGVSSAGRGVDGDDRSGGEGEAGDGENEDDDSVTIELVRPPLVAKPASRDLIISMQSLASPLALAPAGGAASAPMSIQLRLQLH